jgi:hypothetical protein
VYGASLSSAVTLFGLAAMLSFGLSCSEWPCGLIRFLVLLAACGSAIAAWGTAVLIASVCKIAWPLWLAVTVVVLVGAGFAVTSQHLSPP